MCEDLAGSIEVMFFPTAYAEAADLLVEDQVLAISGRLDGGDTPKLVASAVRAPDLSESTGTPVMLRLAPRQCTPEVVARLREVL
ncbi:MAG: hypothetical protein ACRD0K_29630, partial [Egibacteraceae bacterium]